MFSHDFAMVLPDRTIKVANMRAKPTFPMLLLVNVADLTDYVVEGRLSTL